METTSEREPHPHLLVSDQSCALRTVDGKLWIGKKVSADEVVDIGKVLRGRCTVELVEVEEVAFLFAKKRRNGVVFVG